MKKSKILFWCMFLVAVLYYGMWQRDVFVLDMPLSQPKVVQKTVSRLNDISGDEVWQWRIYTAGFGGAHLIPKLQGPSPSAVLWIGGDLNLQPAELNYFANVFVTSPLMKNVLQPYYNKDIYVVPAGIFPKIQKRTNEYAAVIGNPPYIAEILQKKGIAHRVLTWEEAEKATENVMPFTMVFAGNWFDEKHNLDMPDVLLKAAAAGVPMAGYWSGVDSVDPMYFFDDTVSFYMFEEDAAVLVDEMRAVAPLIEKRAERAKEFVLTNFSVLSAADKIKNVLFEGESLSSEVQPKSVTINIPTMVGHYGAGDYWIAHDITEMLEKKGYRVDLSYVNSYFPKQADTTLFLRGRFRLNDFLPKSSHSIYYLLYPQSEITKEEYAMQLEVVGLGADAIISASKNVAERLKNAVYLPQFTNTERFYPEYDENVKSEVLFIGNYHFKRRAALDVLNKGLPITIYGNFWEDGVAKGGYVDNRELRKYYSSAKIVLNDMLSGMREGGFISNRVFDATACGALVISEYMPEIEEIYGDSVPLYKTPEELTSLVEYYLAHDEERREKAERAREITLENFTLKNIEGQLERIISDVARR